jgi:hypothetical protein
MAEAQEIFFIFIFFIFRLTSVLARHLRGMFYKLLIFKHLRARGGRAAVSR